MAAQAFIIQSTEYGAAHLERRVESFLQQWASELGAMSDDEFAKQARPRHAPATQTSAPSSSQTLNPRCSLEYWLTGYLAISGNGTLYGWLLRQYYITQSYNIWTVKLYCAGLQRSSGGCSATYSYSCSSLSHRAF